MTDEQMIGHLLQHLLAVTNQQAEQKKHFRQRRIRDSPDYSEAYSPGFRVF
ncbi:MAG TPA: hypothetical protein PKE45_05765 [Caldilineaceae bacterium]|nr:hypothetical protein [Caldilineaceae bacterium]